MSKKWMPIAAGILEILAGFWMLISAYFLIWLTERPWESWPPHYFLWFSVLFVLGVLAVVGGVFASIHRKWRLALAGAAAVIPLPFITASVLVAVFKDYIPVPYTISLEVLLSISPIVLLILSKREFK